MLALGMVIKRKQKVDDEKDSNIRTRCASSRGIQIRSNPKDVNLDPTEQQHWEQSI